MAYLHITDQVPNERARVQILIDSIYGCTDRKIYARMTAVSNEALGMIENFELAVAHLLPKCPVATKKNEKK